MKYKRLSDYITLIKSALGETPDKRDWAKLQYYGETALSKLPHLSYLPFEEYLLYRVLGTVYWHLAEYSRSLNLFYKAYLIATKEHLKPVDIAYAELKMMDNLLSLRYFKQAFSQFHKVEQYFEQYGNKTFPMDEPVYVSAYISISYYYLYQKELKKVQEIIDNLLLSCPAVIAEGFYLVDYQHLKGEYLTALKDYAQAERAFHECIKESRRINFPRGVLEAKMHLALIEVIKNQTDSAITILADILKDARAGKFNDLICEAGIFLSKCYLIKGMPARMKRIETRIKPFLNKLDTVWLYEKSREIEELFRPAGDVSASTQAQVVQLPAGFTVNGQTAPHDADETSFISADKPMSRAAGTGDDILANTISKRREISPYKGIIGKSAAMQEVYQLIEKIAPTDLPVLLQGETGTGKELVANAIHQNSPRRNKTFLAFNCSAIPETLIESQLFGHTKGAFTGATESKKGYVELASGGTLFIDEISNMPLAMQQKLLRVLEDQTLWPIGAEKPIPIDTRFIFASNQNTEDLVKHQLFRQDLFYRISTIIITLPPLRERKEDILLLINHFLGKYANANQPIKIPSITVNILLNYYWFGNVREVENEVKRISVLHPKIETINKEFLSEAIRNYSTNPDPSDPDVALPITSGRAGGTGKGTTSSSALPSPRAAGEKRLRKLTDIFQRNIIMETINENDGNITQAARQLGYARRHLYSKIRQLNIKLE